MKVLKFGGTSVGTIESLSHVKRIVEGLSEQAIVVVSALGGITDKLIYTGQLACKGDQQFVEESQLIVKRHHDVINGIVPADRQQEVLDIVNPLLDELLTIYKGVSLIRELSQRTLDVIVSYGERMSSVIVSRIIDGACHFDSRDIIKTEKWFNKNIAATELTNEHIHATFDNMESKVAVIGGFISTDKDSGEITNLGRGGSDYTAAIVAAAMDADVLEIWTDVDGFMTADPRIIKDAYVLSHLTFIESMELCNFGAKVIYPPTIYPVFHKNIPIRIRNTFNSETEGTWITDEHRNHGILLKGVSSIADTSLIRVKIEDTLDINNISSRVYNSLSKNGVSVILSSQKHTENEVAFAVRNNEETRSIELLNEEFVTELNSKEIHSIEAKAEMSTVAIVGESITTIAGIEGRLLNTLGINGVNVEAYASGASKTYVAFIVASSAMKEALQIIHNTFLSKKN